MGQEYVFDGETVEKVYESFAGDYWIVTDTSGEHPFGYASLASMPNSFDEWGTINSANLIGPRVWEVPRENWSFTGHEGIDIQPKS